MLRSGETPSANTEFSLLRGKLLSGRVYPEFFPMASSDRVLNLGCGEGPQAIVYAGSYASMVGVDINLSRLVKCRRATNLHEVENSSVLFADVENVPVAPSVFDKVLAIDVIEHVRNPLSLCGETHRVLKPGGKLLITFPVMYDKYARLLSRVGRTLTGKKRKAREADTTHWDPDSHNHEHPKDHWMSLITSCGFDLVSSRATTMFPPFHLHGVPRFWYKIESLHALDSLFCKMPACKRFGLTLLCAFKKP